MPSKVTFIKQNPQPLLFLALLLANFGVYIPWLGLYGDDWSYLYLYHAAGAGAYPAFVSADRPFSAWVYMLFTPLFGEWVAGYHLLLLGLRWLAAYLFWRILLRIWPGQRRLAFAAAAILCIYPGFKQQPLPLEFILHFTVLCLFFLSLWLMLQAASAQKRAWLWNAAGAVSALSLFSVEYFIGLEILRPLLLWFVLRESVPNPRQRLRKIAWLWLPYLGVLAGFLYWRVFIYSFQFYQPQFLNGLRTDAPKTLVMLAWSVVESLWKAAFQSWPLPLSTQQGLPELMLRAAVALTGFAAAAWLLARAERARPASSEPDSLPWEALLTGLLGMFAAGWPYWLTYIPIWLEFPWDRPLLSFLPGVAIFLAALLEVLFRPRVWKFAAALLFASALVTNFVNARSYIQRWQQASSYLQQLTIRAPGLEPGAILLTHDIGLDYYGDSSLTPAINWAYAPDLQGTTLLYRMFDLNVRMNSLWVGLDPSKPLEHNYRTLTFEGDPKDYLVVYLNPNGCLRVLGPGDIPSPATPDWLSDLSASARLELIQTAPAQPARLPHVFGRPPQDAWCGAFQQIELARQTGNIVLAASQARQTVEEGLTARDRSEYLPLIAVLAQDGDWSTARLLAERAAEITELRPALRAQLEALAADPALDAGQVSALLAAIPQ
ncbi:hypothetical protein ADN00_11410 [Ornatilinea apprima]|uniref:Glycosyltransferase RgtA/B/C/D-like domain-containing protein n=1 Tax=Ornatilinea apprima TaxID=1134406 RepID=A0A0P6X8E0_9CHLR|nr:hypothetical protein [Ornatilinea apprima]KPL76557.1 hypothetical protein ADN00_11410 [Ornatilinea apprima]